MTLLAILEHADLTSTTGTALSGLVGQHRCVCNESFATRVQFVAGLRSCVEALVRERDDAPKLLVISAHGIPLTGTNLEATDLESIDLWLYADHFAALPSSIVVFLSACFGGYPSLLALQQRSHLCALGPLVDIEMRDANAFQRDLLDVLAKGGSERSLLRLVLSRNRALRTKYDNRFVFGLCDRDGNQFPRRAPGTQLAAPVHGPTVFQIVELLADERGSVTRCRLEDEHENVFYAPIASLGQSAANSSGLIGMRVRSKYQTLEGQEIHLLNPRKR